MKLKHILIILLHCSCSIFIWAQEPSNVVIGADFFEEMDIYSLLEDEAKNIWITTDHGLFRYDGYEFVRFDNKDQKSNSLLELTMDDNGGIYCVNLQGQIFKLEDDSLHIHFQVPDSLLGNMVYIYFDNNNQLTVSSEKLFVVTQNKSIRIIHNYKQGTNFFVDKFAKNKEGTLMSVTYNGDEIAYFNDNNFKLEVDTFFPELPKHTYFMMIINESYEMIAFYHNSIVYKKEKKGWVKMNIDLALKDPLCFLSNQDQIWFLDLKKGAYVTDINGQLLFGGKKILSDYYLSCFLEDKEGNIWLGTFKKGLLFIPNVKVLSYNKHPLLNKVDLSCLNKGKAKEVYLGGCSGTVFHVDTALEVRKIMDVYKMKISNMFSFEKERLLVLNDYLIELKDNSRFNSVEIKDEGLLFSAIKDIQRVGENELLLACLNGLCYLNIGATNTPFYKTFETVLDQEVSSKGGRITEGRTQSLYFQEEEIWIGKASGLQLLTKKDKIDLKYKGKKIIATSITGDGTHIYVGTRKGILVFKDRQFQKQMSIKEGLLSNKIKKIKREENYLFIAHNKGIQRFDLNDNTYINFQKSDGLLGSAILDFVVDEGLVWVLTKSGLQSFRFEELLQRKTKPILSFVNITVNERKVDTAFFGDFSFEEKKIAFEFLAKSHRDKHELDYFYRLEGENENWERTNYNNNKVLYNALSPGEYTFWVKAVDTKGNSSEIRSYSFSIALPYWRQWWFISFCVLFVVTIVSGGFLLRIRIMTRENKLLLEKQEVEKALVESRQAALRSQMNPHFLFNALNSIQEMIMVNNRQSASKYLGKFANLMRIYLNHSRKNKVALIEEIEALELYFDLEKIRFEDSLEIILEIENTLDLELIKIPSMLIQPYVENAFKHGLLHKKTDKKLNVTFSKDALKDSVVCVIEDNGIGRAKSAQINKTNKLKNPSFSISATQKRLDLLNYNKKEPIGIEIVDLENMANIAVGTKVVLTIPFLNFETY